MHKIWTLILNKPPDQYNYDRDEGKILQLLDRVAN